MAGLDTEGDLVVDAVIQLLKQYAVTHDLEPMSIPDLHETFNIVSITSNLGRDSNLVKTEYVLFKLLEVGD